MRVAVRSGGDAALELIERVMHCAGQLAREHPLLFADAAPGKLVTVEDGDEGADEPVLSTCAILQRELVTPQGIVRAGLIGSVATDPAARGRGLATQALERAEEELARDGCLFALLWADDASFYEKRGWLECGTEFDWLVPRDLSRALPAARGARLARVDDRDALHALYETQTSRVLRTREETAALMDAPEMQVRVLERDGRVVAYACQGRGRDLQGVVHEWAGEPVDVLALARAHLEALGNDLVLIGPPGAEGIAARLGELGCRPIPGVLAMAKLLRADRAAALVARLAGPAARVREGLGGLFVEGPRATVHVRAREVVELCFGVRGERAKAAEVEAATGLDLGRLPLGAFLWGLDSI